MMTFKDLKKLVELPSYKEQRVPTVKALEVSGVPVVTEKGLGKSWQHQCLPERLCDLPGAQEGDSFFSPRLCTL